VVRLYAARHPDAVAGMVLVGSTPEDYQRRIGELDWRSGILGCWLRAGRLQLQPLGLRRLASDLRLNHGPTAPPPASTHLISRRPAGHSP
jgi:hypothetical protein